MRTIRSGLFIVSALGLALPLHAGDLGDKAAPLKVTEWVKGTEVDVTKAGDHVYVVEFWATWCGPCIVSIPHLSELQEKFKGNATFVGVSTDSERTVDKVKPFVKKMGDKMNYTVVIDDDGGTSQGYMKAFGINGIPHAFVVQNGKIVWHQNPHPESTDGDLGEVLEQVIAGKFDMAAAKDRKADAEAKLAEARKAGQYITEYFNLVSSKGNEKEAAALGAKIVRVAGNNGGMMNQLAWTILTDDNVVTRDLELALMAAKMGNKATKGESPFILDTYAYALFEIGKKKEALKAQEKAFKFAEKTGNESLIAEVKERLEKYRKAVKSP